MQTIDSDELQTSVEAIWISAVLLGLVEGLTEFLPVSSTGHLVLAADFFNAPTPPGRVFEIVIQLGAILAVCVIYWNRLWARAFGFFRNKADRYFVYSVLAAFGPAVILGLAIGDYVDELFFRPSVIAAALILGGFVIIAVERMHLEVKFDEAESIKPLTALKIGAVQCLAFIPGVSRSGASIIGARLMGVGQKAAAEFSFFVAIPTMIGATAYDLYKSRDQLSTDGATMIAIGFVVSFLSALAIIKPFLGFVSRRGLVPFAWYRIALGLFIIALLAMGMGPKGA
jgi:undecaprenyl-diphosphatase